jgi:hypothetical protein
LFPKPVRKANAHALPRQAVEDKDRDELVDAMEVMEVMDTVDTVDTTVINKKFPSVT